MIPVSDGFREELAKDNRAYQTVINMTLKNGTSLQFTNAQLWQGSVYIDDAVSPDDTFDVGCAIINKLAFGVNNINDVYTSYDFERAVAEIRTGLMVNGSLELVRKGIFTVDDAKFDGSIINFTMLDYMERFDRQYKTYLSYPATLKQIVMDMCVTLNVPLATRDFPMCNYVVSKKPEDKSLTYREVLSWCAAIAGCFARVNRDGKLEIKWYDFDALADSAPPTELDGGIFDGVFDPYILSDYFNTSEGMTEIDNPSSQPAQVTRIDGVPWFSFGGITAENVYVSRYSWIALESYYPGVILEDRCRAGWQVNAYNSGCKRAYRQEGEVNGIKFLKIRWEGVSPSTSAETEDYTSKWELFLLSTGVCVVNIEKLPATMTDYYNLKCGNVVTAIPKEVGTHSYGNHGGEIDYYLTGDSADGGDFTFSDYEDRAGIISGGTFSWNENVHEIRYLYSEDVALKATTPTGVRIIYQITNADKTTEVKTLTKGEENFLITITDNDFISTDAQAQAVADSIYERIALVYFHEATATAVSDPTIEAGDVGYIRDFRGKYYPIIFSRTKFSTYKSQTFNSNAETASKNSSYQGFTGLNTDIDMRINDINIDLNTKFGDGWNYITGPDGIDYAWTIDGGQIVTKVLPRKLEWGVPPHAYAFAGHALDYTGVTTLLDQEDVTSIATFDPPNGFVIPDAITVGSTFWVNANVKKYGKSYWVDKLVTVQENPLTKIGDIMADFAAHYGDPEGRNYRWFVRFDDEQLINFFDTPGNAVDIQIFCNYHVPANGQYYDRDKPKPVGIQDTGETAPLTDHDHPGERRARNIWYIADTNFRLNNHYNGGTQGIQPEWHQGSYGGLYSNPERYWTPGNGMIWTGWNWWLYASDYLYEWDFTTRHLGRRVWGSELFYY